LISFTPADDRVKRTYAHLRRWYLPLSGERSQQFEGFIESPFDRDTGVVENLILSACGAPAGVAVSLELQRVCRLPAPVAASGRVGSGRC